MRRFRTTKELEKRTKRGRVAVGHGAYLQVSEFGTRSWVFRYIRDGKARHLGMGSAEYVSLAEARQRAYEYRRLLAAGGDPLEQKRAIKRERFLAAHHAKTFKQVALEYIAQHEGGWRGDHSRKQWLASLEKHTFPKIGDMAIADIDVAAVLSVLDPIWREVPETASRVKHRIALILDWAAARELRPHDNPARRPKLLPKRRGGKKHFAALPYADIGAFTADLRARQELPARTLEFLILTATRTGEVFGARWNEINGDVWTIPGERTKNGKAHRVPLSRQAADLLATLPRTSEHVFTGARSGERMGQRTLQKLMRRMGRTETVHGFRSAFRDWAAETTSHPNHVVEQALAHAIANGVEAAYRRGDLYEKRMRLMQDWANYVDRRSVSGTVTPIRTGVLA
jgi:integrase